MISQTCILALCGGVAGPPQRPRRIARLERLDVRRRRTLLTVDGFEGDLLRFRQRFIPGHLDRGVMSEEILAAVVRRDESEALGSVEPLYGACCHVDSLS